MFLLKSRFSLFDMIWVFAMLHLLMDQELLAGMWIGGIGAFVSVVLENAFIKRKIP